MTWCCIAQAKRLVRVGDTILIECIASKASRGGSQSRPAWIGVRHVTGKPTKNPYCVVLTCRICAGQSMIGITRPMRPQSLKRTSAVVTLN